jgi:hypothetical protein
MYTSFVYPPPADDDVQVTVALRYRGTLAIGVAVDHEALGVVARMDHYEATTLSSSRRHGNPAQQDSFSTRLQCKCGMRHIADCLCLANAAKTGGERVNSTRINSSRCTTSHSARATSRLSSSATSAAQRTSKYASRVSTLAAPLGPKCHELCCTPLLSLVSIVAACHRCPGVCSPWRASG